MKTLAVLLAAASLCFAGCDTAGDTDDDVDSTTTGAVDRGDAATGQVGETVNAGVGAGTGTSAGAGTGVGNNP